nr:hypothetical protein [Tanacetum cinerariifolium]
MEDHVFEVAQKTLELARVQEIFEAEIKATCKEFDGPRDKLVEDAQLQKNYLLKMIDRFLNELSLMFGTSYDEFEAMMKAGTNSRKEIVLLGGAFAVDGNVIPAAEANLICIPTVEGTRDPSLGVGNMLQLLNIKPKKNHSNTITTENVPPHMDALPSSRSQFAVISHHGRENSPPEVVVVNDNGGVKNVSNATTKEMIALQQIQSEGWLFQIVCIVGPSQLSALKLELKIGWSSSFWDEQVYMWADQNVQEVQRRNLGEDDTSAVLNWRKGIVANLLAEKPLQEVTAEARVLLDNWFCVWKNSQGKYFHGLQNSPFCERVFPDKISKPLKKVRVLELLGLIKSPKMWSALSDEDSVKVCLLLDAYSWGEYFWRALYRRLLISSVYTSEELVAEYHSITTSVKLIENVGDGDPSTVLKELVVVKKMMNVIERFIKSRNDNILEDSVAKQSVEKEIESSGGKPIGDQSVQHPLKSPNRKRPESSISDVLNGELSFDKKTRNIYHDESSKNEALSEKLIPRNMIRIYMNLVMESEVSCDKYVGGFYNGEFSKLYYTDHKEYPSSAMTQLIEASVPKQTSSQMLAYTPVDLNLPNLNESFTESQVNEYADFDFDSTENDSLSDMVKTGEEEIHLDGLEKVDDPFVQTHVKQNSEALVEPYIVQPPTIAPSVFVKVDIKRRKRKARMLEIKNTRTSFDDDEPDTCVISLEEWESTQFKRARNKKEPIKQSQIDMKEILLVEFHENLSRAPYSRRTKVKLPECIDTVYALGDETSHRFPWGNNDIDVYLSFWLNLLGLNDGGWLSDRHLDAWFELMWEFRPKDADWAIASSYFCSFIMREDIPGWVCNGVRYPVNWEDVEHVFFSINEPNEHYCIDILHIRTGVITLYDSLFSEAVETIKWWIKMRIAFKTYIPTYLQEWGILDAKGIPIESYNIKFVVGKDVPIKGHAYGDCRVWVCIFLYRLIHKMAVSAKDPHIVGLAYREHMFDYFWKYKIAN